MQVERILIKGEYIKLGQFLKFVNIIQSGAEAKTYIVENQIYVNDELQNQRGKKLYVADIIKVDGRTFQIDKE